MNISISEYDEGIIFKNVSDFETKHIFECGQCFRWNEETDGSYIGVVSGRVVRVFKKNDDVYIKGGKIKDGEFWKNYFDLNLDYGIIKEKLSCDKILKEAVKYGNGIRILNQDPFEIVISFIISANNRISMIKRAVDKICKKFGEQIEFEGKEYYSFPEPSRLAQAEPSEIEGCGFRTPYIIASARSIAAGEVDLNLIMKMNLEYAQSELMKLKGVGPKVSDCIALFALKKSGAFPVDVWVKRVMQHFYLAPDESLKKIREFGMKQFGDYAGIAQQYLFYYAREKKIGTDDK